MLAAPAGRAVRPPEAASDGGGGRRDQPQRKGACRGRAGWDAASAGRVAVHGRARAGAGPLPPPTRARRPPASATCAKQRGRRLLTHPSPPRTAGVWAAQQPHAQHAVPQLLWCVVPARPSAGGAAHRRRRLLRRLCVGERAGRPACPCGLWPGWWHAVGGGGGESWRGPSGAPADTLSLAVSPPPSPPSHLLHPCPRQVLWIAASRVYLGLHTPVDILAGALAGLATLVCFIGVEGAACACLLLPACLAGGSMGEHPAEGMAGAGPASSLRLPRSTAASIETLHHPPGRVPSPGCRLPGALALCVRPLGGGARGAGLPGAAAPAPAPAGAHTLL